MHHFQALHEVQMNRHLQRTQEILQCKEHLYGRYQGLCGGICSPQFYQFLTSLYFPVNSCLPAIYCLLTSKTAKKRIIRFIKEKAADIRVGDVND